MSATPIPSKNLQEDLLILLCFDAQYARTLRQLLHADYFDLIYGRIVDVVFRHIDQFNEPPGDALPTILEPLTKNGDELGNAILQTLKNLFASRHSVNAKFAITKLRSFVRRQILRNKIVEASEYLRGDTIDDDLLDKAEALLIGAMRQRVEVFEPGIMLGDVDAVLRFLDKNDDDVFPTGIKELDMRSAGPVRGGLHLFIAPAKAGKTHWLVHLGKYAYLHRKRVLHISLEMDERRVTGRYMQSMFSIGKRNEESVRADITADEKGRFLDAKFAKHRPLLHLSSDTIAGDIRERVERISPRLNRVVVKEFPTGQLTLNAMSAYLDLLADSTGFEPDLILLDYADLMRFTETTRDYRLALGNLYVQLRGLAVERGVAVATVTQASRNASRTGRVGAEDVAEDWSKIATADTVITYAATPAEREMGLARLSVVAGRNDADKFGVIISQNYASGQFVLSSALANKVYANFQQAQSEEKVD